MTLDYVYDRMKKVDHTNWESVFDHCYLTCDNYCFFLNYLADPHHIPGGYAIPKWFYTYGPELSKSLEGQGKELLAMTYTMLHDCGKPFCEWKFLGKSHFPNHAAWSIHIFDQIDEFKGNIDREEVKELIKRDMDIHLLKPEDVEEFCKFPNANILLLAGLAEVNANSDKFGGKESDNFKIKFNHIERRGKKICEVLYGPK